MKHIVEINDLHIGLITSDIDRTEEIISVCKQAINHGAELLKKGDEVILVIGGDVFDDSDPNEYLIGQFIRILNYAIKFNMKVYVNVGNHDAISKHGRRSCLDFIKKLTGKYNLVTLVDDITSFKWFTSDLGPVHLGFLPHVTKQHIKDTKYKSAQEYVDKKAKKIMKSIGAGEHLYIFSHLNVKEVIPGSEEDMLKKSDVYVPDFMIFENEKAGGILPPIIVQAHIHTKQKLKNIDVVGNQIYCSFGEKEKRKYFAVIHIAEQLTEKSSIEYIKTKCKKFIQVEKHLELGEAFNYKEVLAPVRKNLGENTYLKINVTAPISSSEDWNGIEKAIAKKYGCVVKPIIPIPLKARVVRNEKQSIKLKPAKAVEVWMKKNKPKGRKRKLKLALDYIEKYL